MPFSRRGFTLVELLVVIAILAVLTVIATATFTNLRKGANDARRKADIEAIAKAYELKYSGSYQTLADNNFVSGKIPVPPQGGTYTTVYQDGGGFKVCAALENNLNSGITGCGDTRPDYCYCISSLQGAAASSGSGGYVSHPYICDTTGSLGWGLVGYWKMDEVAGSTIAADSSGYGNSGTYTNGATTTGRIPAQINNGITGFFDGSNNYVSVNDNDNLDMGTGDFTIGAWYNITGSLTASQEILKKGSTDNTCDGSAGPGQGYELRTGSGASKMVFKINTASSQGCLTLVSVADISIGWHHVAVVADRDGKASIYLDGTLDTSTDMSGYTNTLENTNSVMIGSYGDRRFFNGQIDDVRIYNTALSPTEIQNLYGPGGTGCIPP